MEPRIRDFYLGGDGLEAYYTEYPYPAMAIDPNVEPARRRMWGLVAGGLFGGVEAPDKLWRSKRNKRHDGVSGIYFFGAREPKDADPLAVAVLRHVLPDLEPDWILDVHDAKRLADNNRVAAAWCGLPVEVVLAVAVEVL